MPADCVRPLTRITLHAARPAGVNEPTARRGVAATEILRLVAIPGGATTCASACSPAAARRCCRRPEAISLEDKLAVTRHLSAAGAEHRATQHGPQATQPDQRRRARPGVPRRAAGFAGHLRRARRPLGPDRLRPDGRGPSTPAEAGAGRAANTSRRGAGFPAARRRRILGKQKDAAPPRPTCQVTNLVIGNNATAVDAARREGRVAGLFPRHGQRTGSRRPGRRGRPAPGRHGLADAHQGRDPIA